MREQISLSSGESKQQCANFDIWVINPIAPSCFKSSMTAVYKRNEMEKKQAYEQRIIEVQHGSFTPLIIQQ